MDINVELNPDFAVVNRSKKRYVIMKGSAGSGKSVDTAMNLSLIHISTMFLTDLLEESLQDRKYYAKEVTLDYGTAHPKRVDLIQFIPAGVTCVSDIEKGEFICYEIKSCVNDVYSGNGLRFYGEQNYIVTTMETRCV